MKLSGNTILITGGGSGIGAALAQRFHDLGNNVIVAGRRREALEAVIEGRENMRAMVLDIEDPEAIAAFAKGVIDRHPTLNVIFNNAGIMRYEDLTTSRALGDAEAMIATNLLGPIRLIDALITISGRSRMPRSSTCRRGWPSCRWWRRRPIRRPRRRSTAIR